jgi:hypothetical protein
MSRRYITFSTTYIPCDMYDVCCVRRCSILNKRNGVDDLDDVWGEGVSAMHMHSRNACHKLQQRGRIYFASTFSCL